MENHFLLLIFLIFFFYFGLDWLNLLVVKVNPLKRNANLPLLVNAAAAAAGETDGLAGLRLA